MKEYQPHELRVIEEKKELDEKLKSLRLFKRSSAFSSLPIPDQELLISQSNVMTTYSAILGERISNFSKF